MEGKNKSIFDSIKSDIQATSFAKDGFVTFPADKPVRLRILGKFTNAIRLTWHNKFKEFDCPCNVEYGKPCMYCEETTSIPQIRYFWSVWDYTAKKKLILMLAAKQLSPLGKILEIAEERDITCTDIVLTKEGKGFETQWKVTLVNEDTEFKGKNIKPFTRQEIYAMVKKSYPNKTEVNGYDDEEDEDDE